MNKFNKEWDNDYEEFWKPLLQTDGKWDEQKIKNEMHDLCCVLDQVSEVYCHITGGLLSKPMYYADVIKAKYDDQITEAYEEGYQDALDDN